VEFQSSPITLPGTLNNYGTILGTGSQTSAANISGGGQLINGGSGATAALIQGGRFGVAFGLAATVTNFATIAATGSFGGETGIYIGNGTASVNNLGAAALVSGYIGVSVAYGTITNSGKISSTQGASGTAVMFGGGSNLLVVDPGAVFVGTVQGSGFNPNTVELSGNVSGTITNFGTSFTNFGTILVDAGAKWTMDGAISIKDTAAAGAVTIGAGADLEVTGALSTADAFALNGGTLHITDSVDPGSSFDMSGGTGDVLQLDSVTGTSFGEAITGFGNGDTITLPGVTFAAGGNVTSGPGTLSVPLLGGGSFTFSNITTLGSPRFTVGTDTLTAVACFAAGTYIRTGRGETSVEALCIDDVVVLADGRRSKITWIGHRAIDCRRHPNPPAVWPVRVAPDALGSGLPVRDLMLSPDHALYLNGMLIPVRLLINGATITQIPVDRVVYYHVELPRHDLLLAEGVATESYLDTGNRGMFENGEQPLLLHPDLVRAQSAREAGSCAPFISSPEQIEPVWRALAGRAQTMGRALPEPPVQTDDPDLHIHIGSHRINPIMVREGRYTFVIPTSNAPARLVSRAARPCDARPWVSDDRLLGVKIRRLSLRRGHGAQDVALDDPMLDHGWWAVERDERGPCRWTQGDATLPSLGAGILEVTLCGSLRYPVEGPVEGIVRQAPVREFQAA
jgi:collagen type I/II/III/V/XI/XXIV/XXVII alpha